MRRDRKPIEHRVVEFTVYGEPAPQGSKKFVGMRGGKGVLVENSKAVKPWRRDVADNGMLAMMGGIEGPYRSAPLDGPLMASIVFTLQRPASAHKSRRWPDRKPDLSKLLRSTEDALVTAGVIADDARIVCFRDLRKVYVGDPDALPMPGARIKVGTMI